MDYLIQLFDKYGYIILFSSLLLELIAFPLPGETLMTYCGFLVSQAKLNWLLSIVVATMGVMIGITISYFLGLMLEKSFFEKYGSKIHLGPDKLEKASKWFGKYGNGLLICAYFIPGVRHITGYFSGTTRIPFKRFALNAYIGALIWTSTFISIGNILGENWNKFHGLIKKYMLIGGIIIAILLICIYLYKNFRNIIFENVIKSLQYFIEVYNSLGKIKLVILGAAGICLSLSIAIVALTQGIFSYEFNNFDTLITMFTNLTFGKNWSDAMKLFSAFTSYPVLIIITILLGILITVKRKDRLLEVRFLLITVAGGEVLEEILQIIFYQIAGKHLFPSEQSLMAVVTYGFAAYMVLRHTKNPTIGAISICAAIIICLLSGLSTMYFKAQFPTDIIYGYAFGGFWLSLNVILMEVFRILPSVGKTQNHLNINSN